MITFILISNTSSDAVKECMIRSGSVYKKEYAKAKEVLCSLEFFGESKILFDGLREVEVEVGYL